MSGLQHEKGTEKQNTPAVWSLFSFKSKHDATHNRDHRHTQDKYAHKWPWFIYSL